MPKKVTSRFFPTCLLLLILFVIGFFIVIIQRNNCRDLKEAYKKEATKGHVCSWEKRNTLYEASHGAFAISELEYTVSVDFLWTKKGDKATNRRVKSTHMKIPVLGETSAVGDALLSLNIKKLKKCKNFLGKEKDKDYCLIVKTGTYKDEKQLTPYVLSQWIPSKYKHGYGCVTIGHKNGKVGLKKVECED